MNDDIVANVGIGILLVLMMATLAILTVVVTEDTTAFESIKTERVLYYKDDNGNDVQVRGVKRTEMNIYGNINEVELSNGKVIKLNGLPDYSIVEERVK